MQPKKLEVFDFDGTLIRTNSFREISKRFMVRLFRKGRIQFLFIIIFWLVLRKCHIISHFGFKQRVVNIFEKALAESEKRELCQQVFDEFLNKTIFERMKTSENCIICTTAPYAYISRIFLGKNILLISSLDPTGRFPDFMNFGASKVLNIKAYFGKKDIHISDFFTDNKKDDGPLIDLATNAYIVEGNILKRIK